MVQSTISIWLLYEENATKGVAGIWHPPEVGLNRSVYWEAVHNVHSFVARSSLLNSGNVTWERIQYNFTNRFNSQPISWAITHHCLWNLVQYTSTDGYFAKWVCCRSLVWSTSDFDSFSLWISRKCLSRRRPNWKTLQ